MDSQIDVRRGATSASNAEADLLCPRRHLLQKQVSQSLTPKKDDKDREFGRKIHAALAGYGGDGVNPTSGLTVAEREVFDACRKIEKAQALKFFSPEDGKVRVFRETPDGSSRLWCKVPAGKPGEFFEHSGQPDVIYRAGTKALIIEYKTLAGDIAESPFNLQLRHQAVLYKGNVLTVDQIGVVVVQPFVTHDPVMCIYTADDLKRAEREMLEQVQASNDPKAQAVAGKKQCEWCLAKLICASYQRWAGSMVPSMLSILDVPVSSWTPDQRAVFCDNKGTAQKWLDACEIECKRLLSVDPEAIPGWKLKPGSKVEKVVDPQKVWERFASLGGKVDAFMGCVAVGKTKLKESVAKLTGAKGKGLDEALSTITEGAVEVHQNQPSLSKDE